MSYVLQGRMKNTYFANLICYVCACAWFTRRSYCGSIFSLFFT